MQTDELEAEGKAPIYFVPVAGRAFDISEETLRQWAADEREGRPVTTWLPPEDAPRRP
jgi:hypothetical protein